MLNNVVGSTLKCCSTEPSQFQSKPIILVVNFGSSSISTSSLGFLKLDQHDEEVEVIVAGEVGIANTGSHYANAATTSVSSATAGEKDDQTETELQLLLLSEFFSSQI